jgi:uncharacterized protein YqhQ
MQEPITDHFAYGGQAVLEGVMMRGRRELAVAVRAPSGEIVVWSDEVQSSRLARKVRKWPFVRGAVLLWDTLALGMRALVFSANVGIAVEGDETDEGDEAKSAKKAGNEGGALVGVALWGTVALSIAFSIGLFFVLPLVVVAFLDRYIESALVSNIVEGLIRLGLLVGYVYGIGFVPDIKRVYGYHGAEHKTIHAWEAGDELDPARVRNYPLEHPRCGTGFLLVVMLLSVAVFLTLGRPDLPLRIASRIVLVPVIAGVAYEFLKFSARHARSPLWKALMWPSLKLQRLTTREPDDSMIEVAVAAFLRILVADDRLSPDDPRLARTRSVDAAGKPLEREGPALVPVPTAAD